MTRVNMSAVDRWLRVGIVAIVAILLFTHVVAGWAAVIATLFAFAFLVSSFTGFCPLYVPLKINTERMKKR